MPTACTRIRSGAYEGACEDIGCVLAPATEQMARPSLHLRTLSIGLVLAIPACSGPLGPTPLPLRAVPSTLSDPLLTANSVSAYRVGTTFPLLNGSFTIRFRGTDGGLGTITGRYTGTAVSTDGRTDADLDLQITDSSGLGSDVTELDASGSGAFVDHGEFTLSLSIMVSSSKRSDGSTRVRTILRGTSGVSCTGGRILITQRGTGSTPRLGTIEVVLQHVLGSAGCGS